MFSANERRHHWSIARKWQQGHRLYSNQTIRFKRTKYQSRRIYLLLIHARHTVEIRWITSFEWILLNLLNKYQQAH